MYQSNYIEDSNRQSKGFKHSNSVVSDSNSGGRMFGPGDRAKSIILSGNGASNPMKTSNYNDMPLSQYYDNILNTRANRDKTTRDSNPMFRSQSMSRGVENRPDINKDIKAFSLPQDVIKFLDNEPERLLELKNQIKAQKDVVDDILDKLLVDIKQVIDVKRNSIKSIFDSSLAAYEKGRALFQQKVFNFKDTTKMLGGNKFGGSSDRLMNLEAVEYFDNHGKVKEEPTNLKCKLGSLAKEIEKKYLSYFAQHLEKELHHWPHLSETDTAKEYLQDMRKIILSKMDQNLDILEGLVYKIDPFDFEAIKINPIIKPSLGESKSNLIANVADLIEKKDAFKFDTVHTSYSEKITCICVIEEDLVATGHSDGSVGIWSMGKGTNVVNLKEHTTPVSSLVAIKAYFPEINLAKGVSVEQGYVKNKNIKQQNFLLSGTESNGEIILWDLQAQKKIRVLSGHQDTVSGLVSLRDGHTVISASLDASWKVWDISEDIPLQSTVEKKESPLYCIHALNDFNHFLTAGKSGDICIYNMSYAYNRRYDRTVFEGAKRVKVIATGQSVFSLNESMVRDNTIISAGADKSISFWSSATGTEQKKVGSHTTEVIGCVLIENPLKPKANSFVLSVGNYDDRIQITDTGSGATRQMQLDKDISLNGGRYWNPTLQFMPVNDCFGQSETYLLSAGTKNGLSCLVKIKIDMEAHEPAHLVSLNTQS